MTDISGPERIISQSHVELHAQRPVLTRVLTRPGMEVHAAWSCRADVVPDGDSALFQACATISDMLEKDGRISKLVISFDRT